MGQYSINLFFMRKSPFLILLLFFCIEMFSQGTPNFGEKGSHEYYVLKLNNAKDTDFQRILALYDSYIETHPEEVVSYIERCKFIGNSYYDDYEGYNLKYDETEECIEKLFNRFPHHPQVLIYRAQNLYGEQRLVVLEQAEKLVEENPRQWSQTERASINRMLGDYYYGNDNNLLALRYYYEAKSQDISLDLSYDLALIHKEQDNLERAKSELLQNLEKDTTIWTLSNKAQLLMDLGETKKALTLFDEVGRKDSSFIDNGEMAKAMVDLEKFDVARTFLVKDTINEWNKISKLQALFNHDLKHSTSKTALSSYRILQKENDLDDFLAIKRLRLFLKDPLLPWSLSELYHLFLLVLTILVLVLLPYLWVLPIFNFAQWLNKRRQRRPQSQLNFNWGLKHFWIISFVYLVGQYLLSLIFYYEESMNALFDLTIVYGDSVEDKNLLANSMIVYVVFMAIGTLSIFKRDVLKPIYSSKLSIWSSLGLGIGFFVINLMILAILRLFVDLNPVDLSSMVLNATAEVVAILNTHGFLVGVLIVAFVGPIYEEIIFRGVILGSVEKHLGFLGANLIQATLFAIVHLNFKMFAYYLIFGLVTGYYAKRTEGLLTGIILHMVNNFLVITLVYFLLRTTL